MQRTIESPAAAATAGGAGNLDMLSSAEITVTPDILQINFLRRRLHLAPNRAALIAALAFPGGAQ